MEAKLFPPKANGNRLTRLVLCGTLALTGTAALHAQYSMDLSRINLPDMTYLTLGHPGPTGKEIRVNNLYMDVGGVPCLPVMGEIHYSRMHPRYWRDALMKMKASGIDVVATYCIWNLHEEFEGELSWEGRRDLRRFLKLCQELGLKVHLRIGPYCNAEIRNGGLPDWIVNNPKLETRSNSPLYLAYARRWYQAVYDQVKGLLYKDGGPVIALQLENEYVKPGQIISHLRTLKRMAVDIGFDVPVYSMTHWMDSEYPRGEIIPYAGFYIEAPWTASGKNEIPTGNFEFFTYNRLSDNIGTDIIKIEGDVQSLSGKDNDSPFFTCEVGVGTTAFYHRRAVVPEEMAGEMVNLRLGCGANLMGYYMYAGGTNPVGRATTLQSSGPRVSYDYQAPIREFGNLGTVMKEVKKYNYFMNDFGQALAPAVAYLPTTNENRDSLQWAVRYDGRGGYLFCSNYLYKHHRGDYDGVQFALQLPGGELRVPRSPVRVKGGTYFLWPFEQQLNGVRLRYATVQPICRIDDDGVPTYFFFEDDGIAGEYCLAADNVKRVRAHDARCTKEADGYFIDGLTAGRDCMVEIALRNGGRVRLVTLTEDESDRLWRGRIGGKDFLCLTSSALTYDDEGVTLIDERPEVSADFYADGKFARQTRSAAPRSLRAEVHPLPPMDGAQWIRPAKGDGVGRTFTLHSLSSVEKALLRFAAPTGASCHINGKAVETRQTGEYRLADVTQFINVGTDSVRFTLPAGESVVAEIEILMQNGERWVWNTDATWLSADSATPVAILTDKGKPTAYAPEEHLALYAVSTPRPAGGDEETRLYLTYRGDVGNLYQDRQLVADSYYDGTDWIVGLDRLPCTPGAEPLIVRIDGLHSADAPVYFEKNVDPATCVYPTLEKADVRQEYRFRLLPDELE